MVIISGARCFGPASGRPTSFQGAHETVIDYALCSKGFLSSITAFAVCDRVHGYDHAALSLRIKINVDLVNLISASPRKKRKLDRVLPDVTPLDKLFIATLEAGKDEKKKTLNLYGPVYFQTPATKVTAHGVCLNAGKITASSGSATYWGTDSNKNLSRKVWGAQTGPRAELRAVLLAIDSAPQHKSLEVSTRSEYAIKSVVYYAARNDACGWRCANGDILKPLIAAIKARTAPLHFRHLKKDTALTNGHLIQATAMARTATSQHPTVAPAGVLTPTHIVALNTAPLEGIPKVSADIANDANEAQSKPSAPPRGEYPLPHRGRDKLAAMKDENRDKICDAPTRAVFWKEIGRFDKARPPAISVTASSLKDIFERRLNPPSVLPEQFNAAQHTINKILAGLIPEVTKDQTAEGFFSTPWATADMGRLKDHLRKHATDSSPGEDEASYAELLEIPNDDLAFLCNECVNKRGGPTIWFLSALIGILKRLKPHDNPDSYRLIALESCFLKALTMLIHWRIVDWATARGLIPAWQNGFRAGYRTNNNPFILRCAKEWARARGSTLYVAAVDASNAFPSTDQPTLWLKLFRMGMGGPIFDWLRMLYERMMYYVRHGNMESSDFKALIGVLTGDPASPCLWNLFLSDLSMMPDFDDVFLAGIRISLLAQADDLLIFSLSPRGHNQKLATLAEWCARNFILINMIKTIILIFGPFHLPLPEFRLGKALLKVKMDEKYVGIHLRTDLRNMFADHYIAKARTARYCGHRIMGIEDMTGRLNPKDLKQLYMARVDCHLIHGCEIAPDSETVHVKKLCKVQISFIRHILNLHSRSMIAPLFTETGLTPLRVRRFLLVLTHLIYFLSLGNTHLARAALNSSVELALDGKKSWALDLMKASQGLPFPCPELNLHGATVAGIEAYSKTVQSLLREWLQNEIDSSDKLYLLHGRLEPQKDEGPAQVTSIMRHYLSMVKTQKHREALTSLLLSTHLLAVEVLRYVDHAYAPVPREDRLCRLCRKDVETPEHALISCDSSDELNQLRSVFLAKLFHDVPNLQRRMVELNETEFLKAVLFHRPTIALLAKYTYEVLEIFYAVPVFRLSNV
jgi:ribonuclease HI